MDLESIGMLSAGSFYFISLGVWMLYQKYSFI